MTRSALAAAERPGHHEVQVADIYARLALVESTVDDLRAAIRIRFDRIEARLATGLAEAADTAAGKASDTMESHLAGLVRHLLALAAEFEGAGEHLTGIDSHLAWIDAALTGLLHPGPA